MAHTSRPDRGRNLPKRHLKLRTLLHQLLDYAFARLPIFGLRAAVDGTTADEQSAMYLADTMDDLARTIVDGIDDLAGLNRNQAKLFELMSNRFGLEQGTRRLHDILVQKAGAVS